MFTTLFIYEFDFEIINHKQPKDLKIVNLFTFSDDQAYQLISSFLALKLYRAIQLFIKPQYLQKIFIPCTLTNTEPNFYLRTSVSNSHFTCFDQFKARRVHLLTLLPSKGSGFTNFQTNFIIQLYGTFQQCVNDLFFRKNLNGNSENIYERMNLLDF